MDIDWNAPSEPAPYLDEAEEDETFGDLMREEFDNVDQSKKWAFLSWFYSAVSYIESELVIKENGTCSHEERGEGVNDYYGEDAYSAWRYLHKKSVDIRYRCKPVTTNILENGREKLEILKDELGIN